MTFNSVDYAVFFLAVLGLYWVLPRRGQNGLLVLASYVFYGWWDWRFVGLLALSTLLDFGVGLRMAAVPDNRRRRWLVAALAVNLGILGFFKYWGFFTDSGVELLRSLGFDGSVPGLRILLPVGISFYTFQSMSYAIDVYRRRIEPCRSLLDYATFVSFFPQLVAGPIERAAHMLPQYERRRRLPNRDEVASALTVILIGLVRKVVIADTMAPLVATGFAPDASGAAALIGVYAFALQIYGDFAGYSAIARGSARLLGIELMVNFDAPYLAPSPPTFWRRWHISLSNWLRDYLYIPLGGNRSGRAIEFRNVMIVMLLGGLWHGASWTFVVWGAIHGLLLIVHRLWVGWRGEPRSPLAWRAFAMFQAACFAWVFFRAASVADALHVLAAIASGPFQGIVTADAVVLLIAGAITLLLDQLVRRGTDESHLVTWSAVPRGALVGAALIAILVFSGTEPVPFIYFQF